VRLRPVQAPSVVDAVYQQLRDSILSGDLRVGEQLPGERRLCEELGVNRGALREALKRLEQDQLILIQQGEPTRVLDFRQTAHIDLLVQLLVRPSGELDPDVVRSVGELRASINPDIARLAAQRQGPALAAEIEAAILGVEQSAGRYPAFAERTEDFWGVLVHASQNVAYQLLNNTIRKTHLRFWQEFRRSLEGSGFEDLQRYRRLGEAAQSGDAAGAEELARAWGREILASLRLAEQGSSPESGEA
jgi:GntR family transcriptional regulator, transcriptional repressor for pyruvate dehydrogenase complex